MLCPARIAGYGEQHGDSCAEERSTPAHRHEPPAPGQHWQYQYG
jgi:hypothetical protein